MKKFEVLMALESLAEAAKEWTQARRKFESEFDFVLSRLLNEAAVNKMTVGEVAKHSGSTPSKVRDAMRRMGLDPKKGKGLLAKQASETLAHNAELMGVEPSEFDLTSPLAYLPMGSELKRLLQAAPPEPVSENPIPLADFVRVFQEAWHRADEAGDEGHRTESGIKAVLAMMGKVPA